MESTSCYVPVCDCLFLSFITDVSRVGETEERQDVACQALEDLADEAKLIKEIFEVCEFSRIKVI